MPAMHLNTSVLLLGGLFQSANKKPTVHLSMMSHRTPCPTGFCLSIESSLAAVCGLFRRAVWGLCLPLITCMVGMLSPSCGILKLYKLNQLVAGKALDSVVLHDFTVDLLQGHSSKAFSLWNMRKAVNFRNTVKSCRTSGEGSQLTKTFCWLKPVSKQTSLVAVPRHS